LRVALTPSQRRQQARAAQLIRWAHEQDREAATRPARQAFLDRFERQVDPDGTLLPEERAKRADAARRAYFARLALKSSKARAARRAARDVA
jgi:hypothetical protein